jgi:hypothetical protein
MQMPNEQHENYEYKIAAHPTMYKGVLFRSRLEARWAAFFDLAGWNWQYEPIDFKGWTPDFLVSFPCVHSECSDGHELYVEVKPYSSLEQFDGHAVTKVDSWSIPSPAKFGVNPHVTQWEMAHGAGEGVDNVFNWIGDELDVDMLWADAGNIVQWHKN